MNERRQFKRYPASLPATMEAIMSDGKKLFDVETKDLSAESAFIYTKEPPLVPEDTRFLLSLTIPGNCVCELTMDARCFIEFEGDMVRSTPEGMAIRFNRDCQIMTLRGT
ncbi:MAG: PilZ domain-containing protein [Desulfobacterales bacterium]|nr:MAG: PilZ domain-containing protein [Desulfobacterales bacterium]UCD89814.1 MAG: PilZ domain-containing protein [Desulfobacterales bacterium]